MLERGYLDQSGILAGVQARREESWLRLLPGAGLLRLLWRLFLLLLLVIPAGTTQAAKKDMVFGQGVLWKVERDGSFPSYVFGTMHVNDRRVLDLPQPVYDAFLKARSASFEILLNNETESEISGRAIFTNGQTLDGVIGPDLYADVIEVLEPYGITLHQARFIRPWGMIFVLGRSPERYRSGQQVSEDPFLDQRLFQEAERLKKKVYALETVMEQVDVFDGLSKKQQKRMIRSLVEMHRQPKETAAAQQESMLQMYLDRDIAGILNYADEQNKLDPALAQVMVDRLLNKRNHTMVTRMQPRLKEGNAFIAVGAGHLPGDEGVLNLLYQQGYKITRIY